MSFASMEKSARDLALQREIRLAVAGRRYADMLASAIRERVKTRRSQTVDAALDDLRADQQFAWLLR